MSDLEEIKDRLDQVANMTESQQKHLETLTTITESQSRMIDKMWTSVEPIIESRRKYEERKEYVIRKMLSGGAWALCVGVVYLIWVGAKYYILE